MTGLDVAIAILQTFDRLASYCYDKFSPVSLSQLNLSKVYNDVAKPVNMDDAGGYGSIRPPLRLGERKMDPVVDWVAQSVERNAEGQVGGDGGENVTAVKGP